MKLIHTPYWWIVYWCHLRALSVLIVARVSSTLMMPLTMSRTGYEHRQRTGLINMNDKFPCSMKNPYFAGNSFSVAVFHKLKSFSTFSFHPSRIFKIAVYIYVDELELGCSLVLCVVRECLYFHYKERKIWKFFGKCYHRTF